MNATVKTDKETDSAAAADKETDSAVRDKEEGRKVRGRSVKLPQCCVSNSSQPVFYVGGNNGTSLVEGPLLALGWRRTTDKQEDKCKLKWTESNSAINYTSFREGEQLVNHIPNSKLLTNKLGLLSSLQEYERVTLLTTGRPPRLKMAEFVPETYKLDDKVERERFLQVYQEGQIWICKPVGMNQGKGIFLLRSRGQIDQILNERETKLTLLATSTKVPMGRIVQRYLSEPLLLEGRKCDIRSYLLIANTVPYLVLYHKGYVRLSCQRYRQEDTNLTTHLTNQYIQKKDPSYEETKEGTVWTMDKLNHYVNEKVAAEKGLETDWVYKVLTKQMQKIGRHCFHSVRHKLHRKTGYFDLYGLDFLVDSRMQVWLIEVNSNPALQTNCQALKETIPCVVEHGLYLAIECFEKSRKGHPLLPLTSLGGYTVLYCGPGPNSSGPRLSRRVSPAKEGPDCSKQAGSRRYSPPRNLPRANLSPTFNSHVEPRTWARSAATERKATLLTLPSTHNIGIHILPKPVTTRENTITYILPKAVTARENITHKCKPLLHPHELQLQQQQPQSPASLDVAAEAATDQRTLHTQHIEFRLTRSKDASHRGN